MKATSFPRRREQRYSLAEKAWGYGAQETVSASAYPSALMRLTNLIFTGHGPKSRGLNTSYVEDTAYRHCERMDEDDIETGLTAP